MTALGHFYEWGESVAYSNPAVTDFKNQFVRDFPYGTDPTTSVLDSDIANAFQFVNININQGLFADQGSYTLGYLLLSAHYLVFALRASSQGLGGQYNFAQNTKSVGQVSEGFTIPEHISNNPYLLMLTKTNYGAQYLELILPKLCGQIFTICGATLP